MSLNRASLFLFSCSIVITIGNSLFLVRVRLFTRLSTAFFKRVMQFSWVFKRYVFTEQMPFLTLNKAKQCIKLGLSFVNLYRLLKSTLFYTVVYSPLISYHIIIIFSFPNSLIFLVVHALACSSAKFKVHCAITSSIKLLIRL